MAAFSGAELLPALLLLAPGYFTLLLTRRIVGLRNTDNSFGWTVASLAISGAIGALFLATHGIRTPDQLTEYLYSRPLRSLLEVTLLSIAVAVVLSLFVVGDYVTRLAHWIFFHGGQKPLNSENWDVFMALAYLHPIQVTTRSGKEFKGFLLSNSTGEETKALRLGTPALVVYDAEGQWLGDAPLGDELLLFGEEIIRVIRLEGARAQVTPKASEDSFSRKAKRLLLNQ